MDYLAVVHDVLEDGSARVAPLTTPGVVTRPFSVHWSLQSGANRLRAGETVICLQFHDGSGIVLCRQDGSWSHAIGGDVEIESNLQVDGNANASSVTASSVSGGSVSAGNVSLAGHRHETADGTTSTPI